MDAPIAQPPFASSTFNPRWSDWRWLALLFALVIPLRGWLLYNTEVLARDSVGYIRYALRFDEQPWGDVLRAFDQHPGYALTIWLASLPVRAWTDGITPEGMQLCAQLVSTLAALLLVVPMYLTGKAVWDARVGFGAALLFQFLPMSGHHLSDGISEGLFICLVAWSLLFAVWSAQTHQARWFLACGAFTGMAYLTRPEGAIVLGAVGLLLVGCQARAAWRRPWIETLRNGACLISSAVLVGSVYFVPMGAFTIKPSIAKVLQATAPTPRPPALTAHLWGDSFTKIESVYQRLGFAAWALVSEIGYALHYLGGVPLLLALWLRGRTLLHHPAGWLLTLYFCLHAAALLLLGLSAGYVSDRHLMPLVMLLCYGVVLGLVESAQRLAAWRARALPGAPVSPRAVTTGAFVMLALLLAAGLPQTLKRVHGNRVGNHAAGLFLAERWRPGDLVIDDHVWSHYYAGQVFLEGKEPAAPPDYQPTCYIVMTRSNDPTVAKVRTKAEKILRQNAHQVVFHWPRTKTAQEARVVVYALPRDPIRDPWVVAKR